MKKNKKLKETSQERKPALKRTIKIIILIILLAVLMMATCSIYSLFKDELKNNTITAIKEVIENEQKEKIKYTIKIKNYEIESATKELIFETEEEAQVEYNRYEIINKYERREIGLELKNKKLILTMPESQLLQDIEYMQDKITIIIKNEEEKEILDQEVLKKCLKEQGYEVKD